MYDDMIAMILTQWLRCRKIIGVWYGHTNLYIEWELFDDERQLYLEDRAMPQFEWGNEHPWLHR